MRVAKITVALSGGLGNQMFQYAAGRRLAWRRSVPLALDTRSLEVDRLRRYALGGLNISATIADAATLPRGHGPIARRLRWLPKALRPRRRVLETAFTFDPSIIELTPPVHLTGNWQSERYFADAEDLIRAEFQLREQLTANRAALLHTITDQNTVSVHVRRGDYISNPTANAFHGTCSPEWYAAAKAKMDQLVSAAYYIVFSDDPHWARGNLPPFQGALFVEPSADGKDEQDMHLMSLCQHHIVANSSFSWWGAWLNPNPEKVVIAPDRWFSGAPHDTRDLIPARWIRL